MKSSSWFRRQHVRRRLVEAICVLSTSLGVVVSAPRAEAASGSTPRLGRTCLRQQTGYTSRATPKLICWPIITCRGVTKRLWLIADEQLLVPTRESAARYGECPTTTSIVESTGSPTGPACLLGNWSFGNDDLIAYLFQATGQGSDAFARLNGTMRYTIQGSVSGSVINTGVIVGDGQFSGIDPISNMKTTVTPDVSATIDASDTAVSFRRPYAFFKIKISLNGQDVPIPDLDLSGAGTIAPYDCSSGRLRWIVNIPAAAGQPARRAEMIWRRS